MRKDVFKPDPDAAVENLYYVIEKLGGKNMLIPRTNASLLHPDNAAAIIEEIKRLRKAT